MAMRRGQSANAAARPKPQASRPRPNRRARPASARAPSRPKPKRARPIPSSRAPPRRAPRPPSAGSLSDLSRAPGPGASEPAYPSILLRYSPDQPSGYRFLEHTADIKVEAFGENYLQALEQSALAMFSVLGPAKPVLSFEVDEMASNREELVVYFLSRVLAECDAREMVPCRVEFIGHETAVPRVHARIWGEKRPARDSIKAVTFHDLKVEGDSIRGVRIQVIFDV